jgi:ubiquitin carboxyl-terminal hydrolase 14
MKPVAFNDILDVYEFCTPEVKATLKRARDVALKAEEDRINAKLMGQLEEKESLPSTSSTSTVVETNDDTTMADDDPELAAALAMSMEEPILDLPPVGPGLPKNFQGYYELFGVVTHKGRDADGGHYMGWVKADYLDQSRNGTSSSIVTGTKAAEEKSNDDWFVFDDDEVSPCKTEDILKLKGGGDWHMSYLNFYRAKK